MENERETETEAPEDTGAPKEKRPDRRGRMELTTAIRRLDPTLGGADLAREIEAHGLSDELLRRLHRFLLGVEQNRALALMRAKRYSGYPR